MAVELAHADVTPEVMENDADAEGGVPTLHKVLDQDTWETTVIGPTASEEVLKKFLTDHADQQVCFRGPFLLYRCAAISDTSS